MSKSNIQIRKEQFNNDIAGKVMKNNNDAKKYMGSNSSRMEQRGVGTGLFGKINFAHRETIHFNGEYESYLREVDDFENYCFVLEEMGNFFIKNIPISIDERDYYQGYIFNLDNYIVYVQKYLGKNKTIDFVTYTYIDKNFRICKIINNDEKILEVKSAYVKTLSNGAERFIGPEFIVIDKTKNFCFSQDESTRKLKEFMNKAEEELQNLLANQKGNN